MKQLILVIFVLFSIAAMSQMRPGMGRNNQIGAPVVPPNKVKKVDWLEESMKDFTSEVKLDDFQAAIIKGYLGDLKAKVDSIMLLDVPNDGKAESIAVERKKFEEQVRAVLNPDQQELFTKYIKKRERR